MEIKKLKKYLGLNKNYEGQTLIEAVVALAVAMLVISALAVLTANSVNSAKYTENKTVANNLLTRSLDEVRFLRDQQTWSDSGTGCGTTGATGFAAYCCTDSPSGSCSGTARWCYKGLITIDKSVGGPPPTPYLVKDIMGDSYNCPTDVSGFSYDTCATTGAEDYLPLDTNDTFFCRRLELKADPGDIDTRIVDVSIAWTDGSGYHKINSATILTKWK